MADWPTHDDLDPEVANGESYKLCRQGNSVVFPSTGDSGNYRPFAFDAADDLALNRYKELALRGRTPPHRQHT
jgi:hypothetical protein